MSQADIEVFQAEVQQKIKALRKGDVKTRREAAAWLGESGEPSAISALRQSYLYDNDPGVKQAAAYSLGMFRSLEQGLAGENSEAILETIEDIVVNRAFGKRVSVPISFLSRLLVGLLTSLVILLAFTFVLWPAVLLPQLTAASPPADTNTNTEPTAVISDPLEQAAADLDTRLAEMTGENGLQTRIFDLWQTAANDDTTGCAEPNPTLPDPYPVPAEVTDDALVQIANLYNAGLTLTQQSWTEYRQACDSGDFSAVIQSGTTNAINAGTAFSNARTQLDSLP